MRAELLAIAIALVAASSGCMSGSRDGADGNEGNARFRDILVHEVDRLEPVTAKAIDGVDLKGHVYVPDGPGPFATVLIYSPYWDNLSPATDKQLVEKDGARLVMGAAGENLTRAGFAVAFVSIRGTGQSDGCFEFMNPQDGADANSVIDWIIAQPWSNGAVGMYGGSYSGWTQDVALRDPSPGLKAVVPYSSVQDLWGLVTFHGATRAIVPVLTYDWTLGTGVNTFAVAGPFVNGRGPRTDARTDSLRPDHLCDDSASSNAFGSEIMAHGDKTPWWSLRDNRPGIENNDVPTFLVHGLTNGEGHIAQLDDRWSIMSSPKRMLIGQWGHSAHLTVVHDFPQRLVAWYDHWLRGGPDTLGPDLVQYQDDKKGWHNATQWPPVGDTRTLYLGNGVLSEEESVSNQMFVSTEGTTPSLAACDQTQVVFASSPLENDVLLAGHFQLNLSLISTTPDANVVAFLFHTTADQVCPDESALEVRYAATDLRHRGYLEQGIPFPINSADEVRVMSVPFATPVAKGERLVLAIGSGGETLVQPKGMSGTITIRDGTLTLTAAEGVLDFE